jgi:hypothetical protein
VIKQKVRIREVRKMGREARRMMGVEELELGKEGKDSLLWLIIMLLSLAAWNAAPSDQAKDNLEQEAISRSPAQDVQFAAILKINLRMQAVVVQLNTRVNQAQGQVAAANAIARQAQAAAQGTANVDRFRPAAPPKYGDQKKGEHVGH